MSSSNCYFLTCIHVFQETGEVICYSHLLENFPQFVVIHTAKLFNIVKKAGVDVILEFSCFFCYWSNRRWQPDLWFHWFLKSSLIICSVLLKPSLEVSEHYFASVWNECKCVVIWTFFDIVFLWDWKKTWPFQVLWLLLCDPHLLEYWEQYITASSFQIWNSSAGIPSPPLALFIVMLPKVHLTSHSRMSGSRWMITPLWLSGSWRSFVVQFFCVFLSPLNIFCFC